MFYKTAIGLLILLASAAAVAEMQLTNYQSGVFQRSNTELVDGERLVSSRREQIRVTDHVPAKLGSKFGVRFSVSGKQASGNVLTYLYLTPGVVEPDGVRHDKYEVVMDLKYEETSHVAAFEFTERYEVVPGTWELLIFENDRLLLRESFNVSLEEEDLTPRITPVDMNAVKPN